MHKQSLFCIFIPRPVHRTYVRGPGGQIVKKITFKKGIDKIAEIIIIIIVKGKRREYLASPYEGTPLAYSLGAIIKTFPLDRKTKKNIKKVLTPTKKCATI